MTSTIITVVLISILIAALPMWKYSKPFGYTPTIWVAGRRGNLVAHGDADGRDPHRRPSEAGSSCLRTPWP